LKILICDPDETRLNNLTQSLSEYDIVRASTGTDCLNTGPVTAAYISKDIADIMWDNLVAALAKQNAAVYVMGEPDLELLQAVIQAGGKGVVTPDPEEIAKTLNLFGKQPETAQGQKRPLRGRLDRNSTQNLTSIKQQNTVKPAVNRKPKEKEVIIHNNKLVVCYAYKGGVGKTILSASLAIALANNPTTKLSVCLVDFDPFNGDIGKIFNIPPKCSILDWLAKDSEDMKDYLVDHQSGVKILPGPINPMDGICIGREEANRILSVLTRRFDIVVVDTTHAPRDSVIVAIENASKVFMIGTPNRVTLQDNRNIGETFRNAEIDISGFNLVINMMPKKAPLRLSDYRDVLPWEVSTVIPNDPAVDRVINSGSLPVMDKRCKAFNQSIYQIANNVLPVYNGEKKRFTLPKLFSKRAVN